MALWRALAAVPGTTRIGAILGHRLHQRSCEYELVVTTAVGAHVEIRTRDLFLTKEVLCRLSYVG